jgi:DNA-directed RNA polymerase specialized sigma24 family protein
VPPAGTRADQIAAFYAQHHQRLVRLVAPRASWVSEQTLEDACAHAWLQLLRHPDIDLNGPCGRALGWLATTAVREAWRLDRGDRATTTAVTSEKLGTLAASRGQAAPSSEELALAHERLDLVREVPERPRRFLLRLMIGYSYDEIASQEHTSYRVVNRQVARAKRLLRQIEQRADLEPGGEDRPPRA